MGTKFITFLSVITLFVSCSSLTDSLFNGIGSDEPEAMYKGDGTETNPYQIKNVKQLLEIGQTNEKWFRIESDLDLSDIEWTPIEFNGNIDGNGHVIRNLTITAKVEGSHYYYGLFSKLNGTISNLTIQNVIISAIECRYIGVFSGMGGTFINCKVIFGSSSMILGDACVGGISGGCHNITDCSVESTTNNVVIKGNTDVGGITGTMGTGTITNCHVSCNITGQSRVGGIVGSSGHTDKYEPATIRYCSYKGEILGEKRIGGIVGGYERDGLVYILGCKVDANITATNGDSGGLVGYSKYWDLQIIGCYTSGKITASGIGEIWSIGAASSIGHRTRAIHCYSVMIDPSSTYLFPGGTCKDCVTITDGSDDNRGICTDITAFLKECYSDYASYWNFDNNWTWEGTVDGETVKVKCPRLAWE